MDQRSLGVCEGNGEKKGEGRKSSGPHAHALIHTTHTSIHAHKPTHTLEGGRMLPPPPWTSEKLTSHWRDGQRPCIVVGPPVVPGGFFGWAQWLELPPPARKDPGLPSFLAFLQATWNGPAHCASMLGFRSHQLKSSRISRRGAAAQPWRVLANRACVYRRLLSFWENGVWPR